ncbi:MAG: hypothetical protein NVS9B10_15940 [Nevskia sp.]
MNTHISADRRSILVDDLVGESGLGRKALYRALIFMESNLGQKIRLEDIAMAACVSQFHFARQFRVCTGYSPMEYLFRIRIERSKRLLAESELPLGAIALELGFCDQSHFTRHFRRLVGSTPKRYARRMNWNEHLEGSLIARVEPTDAKRARSLGDAHFLGLGGSAVAADG